MSNEIDLEQFIQVLDNALASDDPKIKKALKKFLFIAALAMEGDPEPGPFSAMLDEMDDLRRRVRDLENAQMQKQNYVFDDYWTNSSSNATWKYTGGNTTSSGTVTINNPSSTTTSITGGTGTSCGGFVPTTTHTTTYGPLGSYGGFTINLGDDEKGKRIKKELQEKLGTLTK